MEDYKIENRLNVMKGDDIKSIISLSNWLRFYVTLLNI